MSPHSEGRAAYIQGKPFTECPYPKGGRKVAWELGWWDALDADPLLEEAEKEEIAKSLGLHG